VNPQERADAHPFNPFVARAEADRLVGEVFAPVRAVDVSRPVGSVLPVAHRRGDGGELALFVQAVCGVLIAADASVLAVGLMVLAGGA
jgi:hypothetical protein